MSFFSKSLVSAFVGAAALVALSSVSHAATVSIFSTGVDDNGNVLAEGVTDTHYSTTAAGTNVVYSHPAYVANDPAGGPGSAWLGANVYPGEVTYEIQFSLANANEAILSGFWGTDNEGVDIILNGNPLGISLLGTVYENFNQLHSFTTTAAQSGFFNVGNNVLQFVIRNTDAGAIGAFRAANITVATTPIPPSILMFLTAVGGIGFIGYRKRRASLAA